jgi:hypothetical protein
MAWKLMYLEAQDAARNGEAAREAERRAMYARPDALPLPDVEPAAKPRGWLSRILAGARREQVRSGGRSTSGAASE